MLDGKLTEVEQEALREAESLIGVNNHPGFTLVMDILKGEAEQALLALRDDDGTEVERTLQLVRTWRERDKIIGVIESRINQARSLRAELHEEEQNSGNTE